MGGWSGGVYTRFRNWVTDKANSVNPQAALFDQEDDGFAAGLNNCITKDGLNKPSSPMDWNGQNLTGILNLSNTGTISFASGKFTISVNGNIVGTTATSGSTLNLTCLEISQSYLLQGPNTGVGWNLAFKDTTNNVIRGAIGIGTNTMAGAAVTDFCIAAGTSGRTVIGSAGGAAVAVAVTSPGVLQAIDQGGTLQDVGYRDCPLNNTTSSTYSLVLSDRGKLIRADSGVSSIAIPANASVAFPIGTTIIIVNNTTAITVSITSDTLQLAGTATTGTRTVATAGLVTLVKYASTAWLISGVGLS